MEFHVPNMDLEGLAFEQVLTTDVDSLWKY